MRFCPLGLSSGARPGIGTWDSAHLPAGHGIADSRISSVIGKDRKVNHADPLNPSDVESDPPFWMP